MTPTRLREIRTELGLSQAGLAAVLGRHPMTISKWERGAEPIPDNGELRLALSALQAGLAPAE